MAQKQRDWRPPERGFDMRSLIRVALWGTSAAGALVFAALSATSTTGSQRLVLALAGGGGNPGAAQVHTVDAEPEIRRLNEALRTLTTDRERLTARVTLLERNLEDMTGSIQRQATGSLPPAAQNPVPPAPVAAPMMTVPSPREEPPATAEPASPPTRQAATSAEAPPETAPSQPPKEEYGADIGGAANFDALRTLWRSVKTTNGALVEGLHPVVTLRENPRTHTAELRLIVGPLADPDATAHLCAALTAARRYCQPAAFDGQRLADADAPPKPAPRTAAPKAAPKSGIRLFQ